MNKILVYIKKIIPKSLFGFLQPIYHYILNFIAAAAYGFPSNKMTVVGITGTTGKTTVTFMTARLLEYAGYRVGYTSTAMFSDGKNEWLNDKKMTMLGRFFTQKMLRRMVDNGCDIAIVETTSEGIVQYRHRFINYDIVLFTGLYPEHIESHGSFENYKAAKEKLFEHVGNCKTKKLCSRKDQKVIIVNLDDSHASDFIRYDADLKIGFTQNENNKIIDKNLEKVLYKYNSVNKIGVNLSFENEEIQMNIFGKFNALNASAAGCVGRALGVNNHSIKKGLEKIPQLPGRIERIDEGQGFSVIVDYAFEPVAVTELYNTIEVLEPNKIIHVLGSTGGGRDVSRRKELGNIAGAKADFIIVTNEDPYDDDPMEIIHDVASGVIEKGAVVEENLFLIEDRFEAIEKAVSLANENDVILITGKGSEQAIAVANGELIAWDDRKTVIKILKNL
ncbi:MAG: Mur ligase family protein [Candidatus Moraniibacteriota bacterium]|jgi:UDP-N-acetylmuramoyl-L-alanyl-D-glutamate--2,6-diaminopimelate ligase